MKYHGALLVVVADQDKAAALLATFPLILAEVVWPEDSQTATPARYVTSVMVAGTGSVIRIVVAVGAAAVASASNRPAQNTPPSTTMNKF